MQAAHGGRGGRSPKILIDTARARQLEFARACDRDRRVRPQFPSATMAFIQCGALSFSTKDLDGIDAQAFIDPADLSFNEPATQDGRDA